MTGWMDWDLFRAKTRSGRIDSHEATKATKATKKKNASWRLGVLGVTIIHGEARGVVGNLPRAKNAKPPRGSLSSDLILTFFVSSRLRAKQILRPIPPNKTLPSRAR